MMVNQRVRLDVLSLQVARYGAALGGRARAVVRDHAAGLPVPRQHHVGGRRAPGSSARSPADAARVRGHPALDAGGLRRGRESQPDHLRRQRDHTLGRLGTRGSP